LLVDPFDIPALAEAVGGLLQDSERRAKLGRAGREKVTRFAWPAIAEEYRGIYEVAVRGGPGLRRSAPPSSPPPVDDHHHQATRRYKAIYLDHCAKASGAELALARTLSALEDFDPLVVLAEEGPLVSLLRDRHVAVRVLPMVETSRGIERRSIRPSRAASRALWGTLHYVGKLVCLLRAERPHVVVTTSLKSALYGGLAANIVGVPLVWHVADRIEPDYLPRPAVKVVRICARLLPSAVIANSATTLRTLHLEAGPKRPRTVRAIAPPCELSGAGRRAHGSDGEVTIGMVGRLQPWKGQDVFLRAFATAFPDGPAEGVVVGGALFGEDDFERYLADLAAELGLRDRIRFTGHLDDPVREMEGFDILVHASVIPEPFGQVIVEGMALGLPVVACAAGGPAEIITDHVDGLLYPPGDVAALANALRELSTGLRRRLGETAARRAEAYTPTAIAPQVEAVYKQVLGRHE
jgi:glycosyltransferase involved in cell wall biosynthesis